MTYQPHRWETPNHTYPHPNNADAPTFSMALPPPNITGKLHMGHLLNATIGDIIARTERLHGSRLQWTPGTDHATTATQSLIDKQLHAEGLDRHHIGRDAFIDRGEQWRQQSGHQIIEQLKTMNISLDYERERYTLDDDWQLATQNAFHRLYCDGLIYRDYRLISWSPGLNSAIADLEITREDESSKLYTIAYPLSDSSSLAITTTSLHTIPADAALAISPYHPQRTQLKSLWAINPLTRQRMPIIIDERIEMDFGTGAAKITPAHDALDWEIAHDHDIQWHLGYDISGYATDCYEPWMGLSIAQMRTAAPQALDRWITHSEPYIQSIPRCERSGTRIETLPAEQWWLDTTTLTSPIIDALNNGTITISPERFQQPLIDWLQQSRPWCLSRQLWWGQQIPMWQDNNGNWQDNNDGHPEWTQDSDILDTWFSSTLWPMTSAGWDGTTLDLAGYPLNTMISGRDILYLWIGRMLMLGHYFTGELPFREIILHGTMLTADGHRMSKSLGNGIDPLALQQEHGTDATRWATIALSGSQDIRWQSHAPQRASKTLRKLYNAYQLIGAASAQPAAPSTPLSHWIEARWEQSLNQYHQAYQQRELYRMPRSLEYFLEKSFAPWYLEAFKIDRTTETPYAEHLIYRLLCACLPIAPSISEYLLGDIEPTTPISYPFEAAPGIDEAFAAIGARRAQKEHQLPEYLEIYHGIK